jgi:hypothetical protein
MIADRPRPPALLLAICFRVIEGRLVKELPVQPQCLVESDRPSRCSIELELTSIFSDSALEQFDYFPRGGYRPGQLPKFEALENCTNSNR